MQTLAQAIAASAQIEKRILAHKERSYTSLPKGAWMTIYLSLAKQHARKLVDQYIEKRPRR